MAYQLRREDLGFLDRARFRQTCVRELRAPADALFVQLAERPENWPRWFAPANDVHFEGSPPYGVGSTRCFRLYRAVRARERILAWDPGRRFAYCAYEANMPGVSALVEQWTLASRADTATTVTWNLAIDASPCAHQLLRAGRRHIDTLFREGMQRLEVLSRGR
ncbi:SRPBCC family protein [Streptomyces sp. NPDC006654]|uniref:SRPBCC family protein n=1 Tax=unclassified Streptomyces TaxID=2593676 RepID=UPI00340D9994